MNGQSRFGAALAALGPFEENPTLAVAWSGGGDSTALLALAHEWAAVQGGRVVALHVDHGLRANSAVEAALLTQRAAHLGIECRTLVWRSAKPASGIQNAARLARRDLLVAACRAHGIIHLLLGHHADDQDETAAMRTARGAKTRGRAGMSAIVADRGVRLLRPLLEFRHAALLDICRSRALDWFEDPTNRDPRFLRARLRAGHVAPIDPAAAEARQSLEKSVAGWAARAAAVSPAGFVRLDRAVLRAASLDIALGVLARAILCVGAAAYAPCDAALAQAWTILAKADPGRHGRTLGYCRLEIERDGSLLVAREARACAPATALAHANAVFWDGRFAATQRSSAVGLEIVALGVSGWASLPTKLRQQAAKSVPLAARASLPAIRDLDGIVAVPHLSYGRDGHWLDTVDVRFQPRHALTGPAFAVIGSTGSGNS